MKFYDDLETVMKYYSTTGGFLTAEHDGKINTMTVSWGMVGFVWHKPCFLITVRPQRFTNELIENSDNFTISIPFGSLKEELVICGTKSGKDFDKSTVVKFVDGKNSGCKIVDGCDAYFECKKLYIDDFNKNNLPSEIIKNIYPDGDNHFVYVGEIIERY